MSNGSYGTYTNEQSVKRKARDRYLIVQYTDETYELYPPDAPVGFFHETNKFILEHGTTIDFV